MLNSVKDSLFLVGSSSEQRKVFVEEPLVFGNVVSNAAPGEKIDPVSVQKQAGGRLYTLSAMDTAKLQITKSYNSLLSITASCHAINNTILIPPSTKPDWFDDLNMKLTKARNLAGDWLNNLNTQVTSTIPSSILTFDSSFTSSTKLISQILSKYQIGDEISQNDLNLVRCLLVKLIDKSTGIENDVLTCSDNLRNWGSDIMNAGRELEQGAASVQNALGSIKDKIASYNAQIRTIEEEIKGFQTRIGVGAGLVGGGAFIALLGGCLCLVCPPAGICVGAVGLGCAIGGAVVWGLCEKAVKDSYKEMASIRNSIREQEQMQACITSISLGTSTAILSVQNAARNMSDFRVTWETFKNSLVSLNQNLAEENKETMAGMIEYYRGAADEDWKKLCDFARNFEQSGQEVKVEKYVA